MKNKTLYSDEYVSCSYDVNFNDILDLIVSCDDYEKQQIRVAIGEQQKIFTLYDEEKTKILKIAFEKYSIDQLMEKLEIKYTDY
jgi:hypothetical protein